MTGMIGIILDSAWKGTAVFAAAAVPALILRRASASARHLVWAAALGAALAVPFLSRAVPQWKVPVWSYDPASTVVFRIDAIPSAAGVVESNVAQSAAGPDRTGWPVRIARGAGGAPLIVVLWFCGMGVVLFRMAAGRAALSAVRRRSTPAGEPVRALARGLARDQGIERPVEILKTSSAMIPVTWGVLRPAILLPEPLLVDAAGLRVTLTHELAHIARWDYLWQRLGDITCALYWFHPLAWFARREALRLRERACDDIVLRAGARPSDYAARLLDLARSLSCPRLCGVPAISQCAQLEIRLRAILDPRVRHGGLSRRAAAAVAVLAGLAALAIAPVRPAAAAGPFAGKAGPAGAVVQGTEARDYEVLDARGAEAIKAFDFQGALLSYEQSLRARARFGQNSLEYATGLANLAHAYHAWGHLGDAATYAAQALPLLERNAGGSDTALFEPLYILGLNEHASGGGQAEAYYQRALTVARSSAVPGSATGLAWNALATLKAKGHDVSGALGCLDQGLSAIAGEDSSAKLVLLRNRAAALRELGRTAEADANEAQMRELGESIARAAKPPTQEGAPADAGAPYRVGHGVSAPAVVEKAEPGYSSEARVQHVQGTVVLSIVIGSDGSVQKMRMLRPLGFGLDNEAMETVRRWKFEPGKKEGEPVAVQATVEVNFRLM